MIRQNARGTKDSLNASNTGTGWTMHDSRTVANRFLALANQRGVALTPMQLLKLVYIAHGWMLALAGTRLIRDEVQAWQYGPVIPRLYNALRSYRNQGVREFVQAPAGDLLSPDEESLIDQVFQIYGDKSGPQLSALTHAPNTPWAKTYKAGSFGLVIPDSEIEAHYKHLAETRT